jgi:hypothetical protein
MHAVLSGFAATVGFGLGLAAGGAAVAGYYAAQKRRATPRPGGL